MDERGFFDKAYKFLGNRGYKTGTAGNQHTSGQPPRCITFKSRYTNNGVFAYALTPTALYECNISAPTNYNSWNCYKIFEYSSIEELSNKLDDIEKKKGCW